MGDNFLESQAKNAKKRRARAASNMHVPKLIARPDEIVDVFTIDCCDGQILQAGEVLRCFPGANGAPVDVARAHEHVGSIGIGGGETLRRVLAETGTMNVCIRSYDPLTATATAELKKE